MTHDGFAIYSGPPEVQVPLITHAINAFTAIHHQAAASLFTAFFPPALDPKVDN
jgi:hypothetical protein